MLEGKRIAVVVPAYDEAAFVAEVCRTMPAFVDLVVVVDDASHDGTAAIAARAGGRRTRVLRQPYNRGVGAAIARGYAAAVGFGSDVVAVMAGDGQMAPDDLPRLLAPVLSGAADYAKGERMSDPSVRRVMPPARYWGSRVLSRLTGLATGFDVTDSQCGYTAITRAAIDALDLPRLWPRYGYPNDLLGQLALAHRRVVEVPVRPIYRGEQSGMRPRHAALILALVGRAAGRRLLARLTPTQEVSRKRA